MRKTGGSVTGGAIRRSKLGRVITAPFRMMTKAGNFYVRGMEGLAGKMGNATGGGGGGGVGGPAVPVTAMLPKSFSTRVSSDQEREEFRDLVRAASRRGGVGVGVVGGGGMGMRSYSVGVGKIGRIDEDEPCEFKENPRFGGGSEDHKTGLGSRGNLGLYYPRSKSSSITNVGLPR